MCYECVRWCFPCFWFEFAGACLVVNAFVDWLLGILWLDDAMLGVRLSLGFLWGWRGKHLIGLLFDPFDFGLDLMCFVMRIRFL